MAGHLHGGPALVLAPHRGVCNTCDSLVRFTGLISKFLGPSPHLLEPKVPEWSTRNDVLHVILAATPLPTAPRSLVMPSELISVSTETDGCGREWKEIGMVCRRRTVVLGTDWTANFNFYNQCRFNPISSLPPISSAGQRWSAGISLNASGSSPSRGNIESGPRRSKRTNQAKISSAHPEP
jgi:hypothetical protein